MDRCWTEKSLEREGRERKKGDRFFEAQTEFDGIRVLKRDLKIVIKKKWNDSFFFMGKWKKKYLN
jgi:hypothetical protein